eukprot:c25410_g1_i2 orf=1003-2697(-)
MSGILTQQSLRKALGAIKDSTTVQLAKVNSDYKDLDIALVKATNHVECPPKEKHIRIIFAATSSMRPRADVAYFIHAIGRRLAKTHNWAVAAKSLIVVHRILREGDPTFREDLINYSHTRGHILNLSHFKDDSSPIAWDYSAWVRTYALFLEERLECFCMLKYDVESERLRTKELNTVELLEHLPALQQLMYCLIGCQPDGAALYNHVIQYGLTLVLKESVKLYHAISDGIINLVDKFFEMQRNDAVKALEIYKRAGKQTEKLSELYEICKSLDFSRNSKLPLLEQPPQSFLSTMEDYVRDSARQSSAIHKEFSDNRDDRKIQVIPALEYKKMPEPEELPPSPPPLPPAQSSPIKETIGPTPNENIDILGLGVANPDPSALEESNALALAIVPSGPVSNGSLAATNTNGGLDLASGVTGWELALVSVPSNNERALSESKLAGGLDHMTLNSLYDDAIARRSCSSQLGFYGMNRVVPSSFETASVMQATQQDPFYASHKIAPPPGVQLATLAQQQHAMMMHQQMMGVQPAVNPYGVAFGMQYPEVVRVPPQGQSQNNPFENPGLM